MVPRSSFLVVVLGMFLTLGCDKGEPSRVPDTGEPGPGSGPGAADGGDAAKEDAGDGPGEDKEAEAGKPAVGDAGGAGRTPLVDAGHELYARFEAPDVENACTQDGDCKKSGCSGEVCSAAADLMTTCEVLPVQLPADAACGCLDGTCQWWSRSGAGLSGQPVSTERPEPAGGAAPGGKVVTCGKETCKPGQTCIEYYGIAGPKGPKFQSCEWPCGKKGGACPAGTKCVTIADGPGSVCR